MSSPGLSRNDEFQPEEWDQVKESVFVCQTLGPEERDKYLNDHCTSTKVRREVERLLQASSDAQTDAQTFLKRSASDQLFGPGVALPEKIGPFRVLQEIGRGGMGIVYEAIDARLGRHVALKVLHPVAALEESDVRQRLLWEARTASSLNHLNIVTIYEVGSDGGVDYVAMEHLSGRSLADILQLGKLSQDVALRYAVQIASALESAHGGGIVHRDLKPGNIMVTDHGVVKLVDFGLAKSLAGPLLSSTTPQTLQGGFAGTVAYVSPEQATGQNADTRSDVFSFGCVFYEMMTGLKPFRGDTAVAVLGKIIHTEPDPPSAILQGLDLRIDQIVWRCLRKDRERRFQSIADVRAQLQDICDGEPQPGPARRRFRSALLPLGAAAAIASIGLLLLFATRRVVTSPGTPTLSKVTSEVGFAGYPAISKDGKLLAYASDRAGNGNLDLWLQQIGSGDSVRITSDPADNLQPSFSPDGTRIVYRSERRGGGVYLKSSFSGPEQLLASGARDPRFSPDGSLVACWTGDVGGALYSDAARILLVSPSTHQTRVFRPDFETAAFPVWISNSKLLFLGRRKPPSAPKSIVDWWVADIQGSEAIATGALKRLHDADMQPPPATYWIRPEAWLGRLESVVFTATHGDAANVWQLPIHSPKYQAGAPSRMTMGPSFDAWPSVADNGSQVSTIFSSLAIDVGIYKLPLAENGTAAESPQRVLSGYSDITSPSISRDGGTLVFAARQPGANRIVALDMKTSQQHLLATLKSARVVHPVLSGNGKLVAFIDGKISYRADLAEDTPSEVCSSCGPPTDVNFDGSQILFEAARSDEKLVRWSKAGTRPLINGTDPLNRMQFGGRFSPDGRWVAFCAGARDSGARRIMAVPNRPDRVLKAEEWVTISDGSNSDRAPAWGPDGRHIYYLSDQDGSRCIWGRAIDPASAKPSGPAFAVTHYHTARRTVRGLKAGAGDVGLSVARGFLVFTMTDVTGNLWFQQTPLGNQ